MSYEDLNSKLVELLENDDTDNFYSLISEIIEENKEYQSDLEQNLNSIFNILSKDMNESNHEKKITFICLFFEILISENIDFSLYLEKLFNLITKTNLYSDENIKRIINICSNATLKKKNLFISLTKFAKNKIEYLYIIFSLIGFKDIIIELLSENWDLIFELLNDQNIKSNSSDIKNVLKCLELLINISEEKFRPYASSALYQALDYLSETDIADIEFGIKEGFDMIAASFVRSANCIRQIKDILKKHNYKMLIIAKIENREGVDNIDEIIDEADGVMVARGDLGIEVKASEVPYLQKQIIKKCNQKGKIVITATQMLDSMIKNPRPTRAEVADVANAIYDGTDAIMLSGETANGKYPIESVTMMDAISSRLPFTRLDV